MSIFHHANFTRFRTVLLNAPRRPRHPLLRIAIGVLGVALLLVLLVAGVFIGIAMLIGGMLWRLWVQRGGRAGVRKREAPLQGDYRVVGKPQFPVAR
ncbi:MAG: hypothetical protein KUL77_02225 [Thermomonas sp.]|uniref:hypothetical protein n=1 Tax=Thermomonas sp. TaxID=1971895 RepID=UPI001EC54E62|nr:hypothetical protein [Thermomonas sp.]MBV2208363.1 hypothetical protein [Thermomonas sp.]